MSSDMIPSFLFVIVVQAACLGFAIAMTAVGIAMMFGGPSLAARAFDWWFLHPLRLMAGALTAQLLQLPQLALSLLIDPALHPIARLRNLE